MGWKEEAAKVLHPSPHHHRIPVLTWPGPARTPARVEAMGMTWRARCQ